MVRAHLAKREQNLPLALSPGRAAGVRRRHARHPRLPARPRRLGPAHPPAHPRQPARREGRLHPASRRPAGACLRAGADRDVGRCGAACRACAPPPPAACGSPPPCSIAGATARGSRAALRWRARRNVPLIAVNDVLYHHPDRRPLADVLTCIREKTTIDRAGRKLRRQCRAPSETAGGNGAAVPRRAGGDRGNAALERRAHLLARRIALRISRRDHRRLRQRAGCARASHLRRRRQALPARPARQGARQHRARTRADRAARLRALFPHRLRHRALRALARNPLPGPRLGGQFRGLLLPRRHRGRSRPRRSPVRALHLARAARAARHRRRFRARAARGGHPIHLRQIRPRARRHRRHRDLLSRPLGHPRGRQGLRPLARTPSARWRPRSGAAAATARPTSRAPGSTRTAGASSRSRRWRARSSASRAISRSTSAASSSRAAGSTR